MPQEKQEAAPQWPAGYRAPVNASSQIKALGFFQPGQPAGDVDLLAAYESDSSLPLDTSGQLEILFQRGGARWAYRGVALGKALALLSADSPGAFFNAEVKMKPLEHRGYQLRPFPDLEAGGGERPKLPGQALALLLAAGLALLAGCSAVRCSSCPDAETAEIQERAILSGDWKQAADRYSTSALRGLTVTPEASQTSAVIQSSSVAARRRLEAPWVSWEEGSRLSPRARGKIKAAQDAFTAMTVAAAVEGVTLTGRF